MDDRKLALAVAEAALEKQALALEIIDVRQKVDYTSYIVICSGRSERQVEAIVQGVERSLRELGVHPLGSEGKGSNQWVLIDFGDVIFHAFEDERRGFYDLDSLWIDAERVPLRQAASVS